MTNLYEIEVARYEALKVGLSARCPKHPTYRGIRKPRIKCKKCKLIWQAEEHIRAVSKRISKEN